MCYVFGDFLSLSHVVVRAESCIAGTSEVEMVCLPTILGSYYYPVG